MYSIGSSHSWNYKLEKEIYQLEKSNTSVHLYWCNTAVTQCTVIQEYWMCQNGSPMRAHHLYPIISRYPTCQSNNSSPPIILKVAIARWRTARVIISLILPNQSQRSRSSAIANDMSSAVCRIAKYGMQNLRPSCDYHCSSGFGFVYG